jgi:hypothetical protein
MAFAVHASTISCWARTKSRCYTEGTFYSKGFGSSRTKSEPRCCSGHLSGLSSRTRAIPAAPDSAAVADQNPSVSSRFSNDSAFERINPSGYLQLPVANRASRLTQRRPHLDAGEVAPDSASAGLGQHRHAHPPMVQPNHDRRERVRQSEPRRIPVTGMDRGVARDHGQPSTR